MGLAYFVRFELSAARRSWELTFFQLGFIAVVLNGSSSRQ
jgi:hypothetical protein